MTKIDEKTALLDEFEGEVRVVHTSEKHDENYDVAVP